MLNLNGHSWGFTAVDVWTNTMTIVETLAPFVLFVIVYVFTPKVFNLIRDALEEHQATRYEKKYKRRGYYYMNQDQIDQYERSIRFKPWKW